MKKALQPRGQVFVDAGKLNITLGVPYAIAEVYCSVRAVICSC